jgi:hypothetical protein
MMALRVILLILALICFCMSAVQWPPSSRVNLLALGLALWVLSLILPPGP